MGHILYQIAVDLVLCVLILSLTAVPALRTSQPGKQSSAGDSLSTDAPAFPPARFPAFIPPPPPFPPLHGKQLLRKLNTWLADNFL